MTTKTEPGKGAAALVRSRPIDDVDGFAAAIADGLHAEYVQLEAKPFAARWTVVPLPRTVVQLSRADVALVRRIRIPARRWAFLVPLSVPESARWNARPVSGNELFVCPPESECYAFDPSGTEFAIISVADETSLATLARAFAEGSAADCTLLPRARDAQALQRRLRTMLGPRTFRDETSSVALRDGINGALDACLRHAVPAERGKASAGRSRIVRRAEEFFRTHLGEPVSMAQLSSQTMVSERCLRDAFYQMYAISPKRYLRLWQLHQVRRALGAPDRRRMTVTAIATCHGFYELGRFAGEYKALFGEAPSQTLYRARRRQSAAFSTASSNTPVLHTPKAQVIGSGTDVALAARANHVA